MTEPEWIDIGHFKITFMQINKHGDLLHLPLTSATQQKTDCGYRFDIQHSGSVTMLVRCEEQRMIVDNSIKEVNPDITTEYHFRSTNIYGDTAEYMTPISRPLLHCINSENTTFSFSTPSECIIRCFLYDYKPAFSIESTNKEHTTFFIDIACNYLLNLQRYKPPRKTVPVGEHIDVKQMSEILYYSHYIKTQSSPSVSIISTAKKTQRILHENGIDSVIFGSLANVLNGAKQPVRDIDLMFTYENMIQAKTILMEYGEIIEDNPFRSRISIDGNLVELSYDRFKLMSPPSNISRKDGLTYFNEIGLLIICLMSFYRLHRDTHVFDYTTKAEQQSYQAYRLLNPEPDPTILPGIQEDEYKSSFLALLSKLHQAEMGYYDIRINRPFSVQCYKDENVLLLPIVSRGSNQHARIIVPGNPHNATWRDISDKREKPNMQISKDFTMIFINDIWLPGVLSVEYRTL